MFVCRHDSYAIWIEVDESEDGNFGMMLGEEMQELPCLDVWVAFCLGER
jgi:hypothetical protein